LGGYFRVHWDLTRTLGVGGNYTFIDRDLDFVDEAASLPAGTSQAVRSAAALTQMEGPPKNKAFFYLAWKATNQLTLTPSLEVASDRTAPVTNCASTLSSRVAALPPSRSVQSMETAANLSLSALRRFRATSWQLYPDQPARRLGLHPILLRGHWRH